MPIIPGRENCRNTSINNIWNKLLVLEKEVKLLKEKCQEKRESKGLFTETFIDVIKYCPYAKENYTVCTEFEPYRSCGSLICARKQAYYYSEKCKYLENKLDTKEQTNEKHN